MAPFRLQDLPGELRNQAYGHISLPDKLTLLRTSRRVNSEVSPLLYKDATCRILVNVHHPRLYTKHPVTRPPPRHVKDRIQNLDVYWVLYGPEERKEGDVEALSWDPHVSRGRCRVFLGWYPTAPASPMSFRESDLGPLKTLAGFETVEIRVGLKATGRLLNHHVPVRDPGDLCTPRDTSCSKMLPMYELLGSELKSTFGVAELIQSAPDHYLRFQPRKHSTDTFDKS